MESIHPRVHTAFNLKDHTASYESWKARAQPKCRFFAWMLLRKKILTANNLIKRNWPNDPICKLCGVDPENPTHLCKGCPSQNKYSPS